MSTESQSTQGSAVSPLKYVDRLQRSNEEKDRDKLQYVVDGQKHSLEGHILETRTRIASIKSELEDLKNARELDIDSILGAQTELRDYEEGLRHLQALKEELF